MKNIIGREEELKQIKAFLSNNKQNNLVIYGKKRSGKTTLIEKSLEKFKGTVVFYQCRDINMNSTIRELTNLLQRVLNNSFLHFTYIEDVISFCYEQKNLALVLDEYHNLEKRDNNIHVKMNDLAKKYKGKSKLKLFITSEYVIDGLNDFESLTVNEHNYLDASLYYKKFKNDDKVRFYACFGGDAYFNSLINEDKSFIENLIELGIKENSPLEMVITSFLNSELGKITIANDVLLAMASGKHKNKDICEAAGVGSAQLDNALRRLVELDVVERITPINDPNNRKKIIYFIKNNAINFYYRFIFPYLTYRSNMSNEEFYEEFIKNDFEENYLPQIYELISKQFLSLLNATDKIDPKFKAIGSYYYDDKLNSKNDLFDVVTLDDYGYVFYNVTFNDKKVSSLDLKKQIFQLKRDNIQYYNLGFITKSGSSIDSKIYKLYSLNDVYNVKKL